jgi:galactan endo-1,6-beta-galactosidase
MPDYKAIETFWVDWASNDTNSSSWDWTKDASQRTMLQLAKERGANIFELFSNSPPWWMTYTNASSGGTLLGLDNLREDQHQNFAYYLAAIAKHAQDEWGIEFDWIQPFNEPGGPWWIFPWTQEGCRFSILTQIVVIKSLRQQLDRMGLQSVSISASDENNPDQTLINIGSLAAIGRDALNLVGKINTHGYYGTHPYRGPSRGLLYRATSRLGKLLWNSEHGEGDASGINMAETISYDFNDMHVNGWVYWQPIDGGGWGLFDTDIERGFIRRINTKYYVLAQYSRHIRPGMRIMANDDSRTVVAYSAKRQLLVLVSVNTGDEAYSITYDLSKFSQVKGPINVWSTETESKKTLYTRSHLRDQVDNKTFEAFFQKKHVQTFEVHGVVL